MPPFINAKLDMTVGQQHDRRHVLSGARYSPTGRHGAVVRVLRAARLSPAMDVGLGAGSEAASP